MTATNSTELNFETCKRLAEVTPDTIFFLVSIEQQALLAKAWRCHLFGRPPAGGRAKEVRDAVLAGVLRLHRAKPGGGASLGGRPPSACLPTPNDFSQAGPPSSQACTRSHLGSRPGRGGTSGGARGRPGRSQQQRPGADAGRARAQTLAAAQPLDGPLMARYRGLARETGLWLSLGGFQEPSPDPERTHNTHVILDAAGETAAAYSKARPPC